MQTCNLCAAPSLKGLIDFGAHPIAHRFVEDPSLPEYTHSVSLAYCASCGLAQLADPVPPGELYAKYTVLSSWKPEPHIPGLISRLAELPGITRASSVIEAGSNDGVFLAALRDAGWSNILGIEPASDAVAAAATRGAPTMHAFFNPETAAQLLAERGPCDLFIARQVLEHIGDIPTFTRAMLSVLRPGGYVLFEVPNGDMTFRELDYSGIWEEHVNYFTLDTLSGLLASIGIRLLHSSTTRFSGEILTVIGQYSGSPVQSPSRPDIAVIERQLFAYRDSWPAFRAAFIAFLGDNHRAGHKNAIFGAGCRACSLINFTGAAPLIEFIVDDQPGKQGKLMPGSHLPIRSSDALDDPSVDVCLLAVNAENDEKVVARNIGFTKRGGRFYSILPPSDNLPPFWKLLHL